MTERKLHKVMDIVELSNNFEYSELSSSGLIWKVDIYCGNNYIRKIKSAGDQAGYLQYKKSGKIDGWIVGLNGHTYFVHRVICKINGMLNTEDLVVDHVDGDPSNNLLSNLRVVSKRTNSQNCSISKRNSSGTTGVTYNKHNDYWQAVILNFDGERITKAYSCSKYGAIEAKDLAIKFRQDTIEHLNKNGMNYTERHGK
jgi:hypothetical protein